VAIAQVLAQSLMTENSYEGFANKNGGIVNGVFGGPALQSELANLTLEMPDIAQVRRLTGKINKVWAKSARAEFDAANYIDENIERLSKAGQLRLPFATANYLQEQIFRKVILATGGFGHTKPYGRSDQFGFVAEAGNQVLFATLSNICSGLLTKGSGQRSVEKVWAISPVRCLPKKAQLRRWMIIAGRVAGAIMAHYQDPDVCVPSWSPYRAV
jgi:hypothetical protein